MKIDLKNILVQLGLPLALLGLMSLGLGWLGFSVEFILGIAGSLVGIALLISTFIDVGKWLGFVDDGTAPKWSAGLSLAVFIGIPVVLKIDPLFNFALLDARIGSFAANVAVLLFYLTQLVTTKQLHDFMVRTLGWTWLSYGTKGARAGLKA